MLVIVFRCSSLWLIAAGMMAVALRPICAADSNTPDFNRDVRPILSAHCFKCHGPDDKAREAGLRLDRREIATARLESEATAIVPGQPDKSELVRRIFSTDEAERMPPPAANKPLSDAQQETLRRWVAAGAEYAPHWAFVRPRQAPLPQVQRKEWPQNPIDYFILARLEAAGLSPSPPTDKYTLIRRVYLDLVGLPPTPEEADEFVRACSPAVDDGAMEGGRDGEIRAYEAVVDKLLASPAYGERWARRWLDLARYADTNGYEKDRVRSMWPYRDWVIGAINRDLPFDQFTIEQLAGDMLPGATDEQRIATGFHRNTMINEEGGIDPLEFRYYASVDRINTTATVWLGLTLGCAQCHTHKFDPIPHQDYYRLMAFLDNADEPTIDVPQPELAAQRREIERKIAALQADLPNQFPLESKQGAGGSDRAESERPEAERRREHLEKKFAAWQEEKTKQAVAWTLLKPLAATSQVPTLAIENGDTVFASGDMTKRDVYDVTYDAAGIRGITAIRLEVLSDPRLPKGGPGRIYYEGPFGDFFLSKLTLSSRGRLAPRDDLPLAERADHGSLKFASAGHSFANGNNSAPMAIDDDPQTGWSINGGQGRAHQATFLLAEPLKEADQLRLQLLFERYYAAGLGKFRLYATADPRVTTASDLPTDVENILAAPADQRSPDKHSPDERQRLLSQFLATAPELAAARAEIDKRKASLPEYPTTLVMQERPASNPRQTFVHHRGEFLQPTEPARAEVLSIFPPLAPDTPHDRLAFARWLVDPANPLVGRVTMNRQWAAFFGTGLVRTTVDFGYQGQPPTHPELLDWLAVELINRGWSMKQMHKLIVTSATYQQSAATTPEQAAKDPQNTLLAHFPRQRLDAEAIRDCALAASGLLSHKLGGPSVFPPQPASVTAEGAYGALGWKVSAGEDRYRRGLYTFTKRTAPYAMFQTFDGPSGEVCVARREESNTPLQSLTLLNDAVFLEASQALANMAATSGRAESAPDERLTCIFRRCLIRPPTGEERAALLKYYGAQLARLKAKQLDAAKIAGEGDGDINERAAWTLVARAILNLDETITKQ